MKYLSVKKYRFKTVKKCYLKLRVLKVMNVNQQVKHYKYVFIIINAESNTSFFFNSSVCCEQECRCEIELQGYSVIG